MQHMFLHPVLTHLQQFLNRYSPGSPVLVAVSGGPDSVCLMHALLQCQIPFHVAHFNHGLRGDESVADAAYVKGLAHQHGVRFHLGTAAHDQLQPHHSGIECKARYLRYRWLIQTARQHEIPWIMTGHTLNDQAETVLHHLIRGTGWRGLRGIAPRRRLTSNITLGRPLLKCSRQDVMDFLSQHQLTPRHDCSNLDLRFTRNRLRHDILPRLVAMNPQVVAHLAQWAEVARQHYASLTKRARELTSQVVVHQNASSLTLRQAEVKLLDQDILQELLRQLWRRQGWPRDAMNQSRWYELIEVCRGSRTAVELPGRIMARSRLQVIQIMEL